MAFRYLFVSIDGVVTGTNDAGLVIDLSASDTLTVMIDTEAGTYANEDDSDMTIGEQEAEDDSDDADDDGE